MYFPYHTPHFSLGKTVYVSLFSLSLYLFVKVHFTLLLYHIFVIFAINRVFFSRKVLIYQDFPHSIQCSGYWFFSISQNDSTAVNGDNFRGKLFYFHRFHVLLLSIVSHGETQSGRFIRIITGVDYVWNHHRQASGGWQPLHRLINLPPFPWAGRPTL